MVDASQSFVALAEKFKVSVQCKNQGLQERFDYLLLFLCEIQMECILFTVIPFEF